MAVTKKALRIWREKKSVCMEIDSQRGQILVATMHVPAWLGGVDATRASQWRQAAEQAWMDFRDRPFIGTQRNTLAELRAKLAAERAILDDLRGEQAFALEACNA